MRFHAISLFPHMFDSYINESIFKKALDKELVSFACTNPRDFTDDKHQTVDDSPFGGGPGMVLKAEPFLGALESIENKLKSNTKKKIIIFSPHGSDFTTTQASEWAEELEDLIFLCGRYEGLDSRVEEVLSETHHDDEVECISIGNYILTGGELPALIVMDAVSRHIPGVLGNEQSPEQRRVSSQEMYTRPESFAWKGKEYSVPEVLLSGNHAAIEEWRREH